MPLRSNRTTQSNLMMGEYSMSRIPFKDRLTLSSLQSELGSTLERFWHCGLNIGPLDGQDFAPAIELREAVDSFRLTVELPGVELGGIDVHATANTITISGQKPPPPEPPSVDRTAETSAESPTSAAPPSEPPPMETASTEPENAPRIGFPKVVQSERRYGQFRREITLPGLIETDRVQATMDKGVLELQMPKAAGSRTTQVRIEVQSSGQSSGEMA